MNYGFFDAANDNHQATLLFDATAAAAAGSRSAQATATQLHGMEVSALAISCQTVVKAAARLSCRSCSIR
jgi:hypothetical protein